MVHTRTLFSLNLLGDTVYAVGGQGDGGGRNTVESYTEEGGWILEGEMAMDTWRAGHCSVVWDRSIIITVGGEYGSGSNFTSVQSIDTRNKTGGWTSMESMKTGRYSHGCDVWTYEGNTGIVVAGGCNRGYLGSVEFYSYRENSWIIHYLPIIRKDDYSLLTFG